VRLDPITYVSRARFGPLHPGVTDLQVSTVGVVFSKIHPFLHFHIPQVIRTINSMAKGVFICCLRLSEALSVFDIRGADKPIEFQHDFAKLHLRKRW
jgi:hypothetical protein